MTVEAFEAAPQALTCPLDAGAAAEALRLCLFSRSIERSTVIPVASQDRLEPGGVVAHRFCVEERAEQGGMGTVYRAVDTLHDAPVALKVLTGAGTTADVTRFTRESEILAQLVHPGIVPFISSGQLDDGTPYLVTEWIAGATLARRLKERRLTIPEVLAVFGGLARALDVAHRRGVVHRDIKPSNIFLRGDRVDDVVLIDFGIALRPASTQRVTHTGMLVGTPEYMAPEQARGAAELTPAADIFSLGCVIYECLHGRSPFAADHVAAVLTQILFDEPAPAEREDAPTALVELVRRMLRKDPADRPPDAGSLLAVLDALQLGDLGHETDRTLQATGAEDSSHLVAELHLITMLVARARAGDLSSEAAEAFARHVAAHGMTVEILADRTYLGALGHSSNAVDAVALAHLCAVQASQRWPGLDVALVTGHRRTDSRQSLGELVARALALIPSAPERRVVVDTMTADLLSYVVADLDGTRPLLGRPTPCVGREQELGMLEASFLACAEEGGARAIVVKGEGGLGKSRLRQEFFRRLRARGAAFTCVIAAADRGRTAAPHAMLAQAIRRRYELAPDAPRAAQYDALAEGLARDVPGEAHAWLPEFFAELCGLTSPHPPSPRLVGARSDPRLLHDLVRQAFLEWAIALARAAPLILVLEDLHWCDPLTVRAVEALLAEGGEHAILVLATARPEVDRVFPGLWGAYSQQLTLQPLRRRACEVLIRNVLGEAIAPGQLARLVDGCLGNAYFLEELVRFTAGGEDAAPSTVLAILQARLGGLAPHERRVIRAASVLGESFTAAGVSAVLHGDIAPETVESWLGGLARTEFLERVQRAGGDAYAFRNALMREAAYGLMTADDKARAHRFAAGFLAQSGHESPVVIADHYHRAGVSDRAAQWYALAAEQSYRSWDLTTTTSLAELGIACGAGGELRGMLRVLQGWVDSWQGEFGLAAERTGEGAALLPEGSVWWIRGLCNLLCLSALTADEPRMHELSVRFLQSPRRGEAAEPRHETSAMLVAILCLTGRRDLAGQFLEDLRWIAHVADAASPRMRSQAAFAEGNFLHAFGSAPGEALVFGELALAGYADAHDRRSLVFARDIHGRMLCDIGQLARGVSSVRAAHALAHELHEAYPIAYATAYLADQLSQSGDPACWDEAAALAEQLLGRPAPGLYAGVAAVALARTHVQRRQPARAEAIAREAIAQLDRAPLARCVAESVLAEALLQAGAHEAARAASEAALECHARHVREGHAEMPILRAAVDIRLAAGDREGARRLVHRAHQGLLRRCGGLPDELRVAFLEHAPHRRLLDLAAELGENRLDQGAYALTR